MNNYYNKVADLAQRIANLSEEKYQLINQLLKQKEEKHNLNFGDESVQINQQKIQHLTSDIESPIERELYEIAWYPLALKKLGFRPVSSDSGCWLIFTDTKGIGQTLIDILQQQGDHCIQVIRGETYQQISANCYAINPLKLEDFKALLQNLALHGELPTQGIVHLWSLETTSPLEPSLALLKEAQIKGCASVLHLIQALDGAGQNDLSRLWLITQSAIAISALDKEIQVQQSPLWGLGRTILLEYPGLQCTCVDWDYSSDRTEIQQLADELIIADKEQQIAWRAGTRYVGRLVRQMQPSIISPQSDFIQTNSSYLITGGLGALGLKLADWLVQQGAESVILMGRKPATSIAQATVEKLEKFGARISLMQVDVANADELAQALTTINSSLPPLRGIIHAAGLLKDGTLRQLSWQNFTTVMKAKIEGSWNLHQQTKSLSLDFFICFSSMTAMLGKAGQANYAAANVFMDSLAHYRRLSGLEGLSINWGPWTESGMAAQLNEQIARRFAAEGINSIVPQQGLQLLNKFLATKITQVGVLPIYWSKFLQQFPSEQYPSIFLEISKSISPPSLAEITNTKTPAEIKLQLPQATQEEQKKLLSFYLQNLIAKLLGFSSINTVDIKKPLSEIGLDSLVSIQIKNRIRSDLELDLSINDMSGESNIDKLVQSLQNQLLLKQLLQIKAQPFDSTNSDDIEEFVL